jgi:hypothetical protein
MDVSRIVQDAGIPLQCKLAASATNSAYLQQNLQECIYCSDSWITCAQVLATLTADTAPGNSYFGRFSPLGIS